MPDNCEPCLPVSDGVQTNPAGVVDPNTPVGGADGSIPAPIPTTAPGPVDPEIELDTADPNYAGGFPSMDLTSFQDLCNTRPTITMMQGLIMSILANHFGNAKNIINPHLRQYTWNADDQLTKLILNVEEDWDPQIAERRPALYLSRQEMSIFKLSINDAEHGGRRDGKQYFDMLIKGSHTMVCRAMNSKPPDDLAFEAAMVIARVAPIIRVWLKLAELRVTSISAKQREDEDPQEAYKVLVTIPWAFWYRWEINPSAPALEFIDLQFFQ